MCNMCTKVESIEAPQPPPPKVSRMLEKMKKKHNIITDPACDEKQKVVEYQPDLLAISTQYSKVAYDIFKRGLVHLQESKAYVWVGFFILAPNGYPHEFVASPKIMYALNDVIFFEFPRVLGVLYECENFRCEGISV